MGLMVVAGQPKKNSEFIQASSRVGRNSPEVGLVVSFFNGKRARDRSYFEVFPDFIQSFYKYVEPTTVTPYTFSVRERMLRQILVTLIRHTVPNKQSSPQGYDKITDDQFSEIKGFICNRVHDDACRQQLSDDLDKMIATLKNGTKYNFYEVGNNVEDIIHIFRDPLLTTNDSPFAFPAPAMQALRNVDAQVPVRTLPYPNNIY